MQRTVGVMKVWSALYRGWEIHVLDLREIDQGYEELRSNVECSLRKEMRYRVEEVRRVRC